MKCGNKDCRYWRDFEFTTGENCYLMSPQGMTLCKNYQPEAKTYLCTECGKEHKETEGIFKFVCNGCKE